MPAFDIAIVGGGILGIAHAYHALRSGLRVAVLEKDPQPEGATVRNFGQIVPSGMDAKWQLFGRKSLEIYRTLQAEGDITVQPGGSVYLASNAEEMTLLEELAGINREQDYESRLLSRSECLNAYPGLRPSYVVGGLYFPQEITIDPLNAVHRIIHLLQDRHQLAYFPNTWVSGIQVSGGAYALINNRRQPIEAQRIIICSGNDFRSLFPDLFSSSPLQSVKLQMLLTRPQPTLRIPGSILTGWTIRRYESFQACPSFPSIKGNEDASAYHRKMGIHILFKQTADGSIIIGDSHEYWDAGEAVEFRTDQAINNAIMQAAREIYQLEDTTIEKTWIGIYSQCKDRDIFECEVLKGVHIVTGIGGKGMTASFGYAATNLEKILNS